MPDPPRTPTAPEVRDAASGRVAVPSLWRDLRDGTAGPAVKTFVCALLAPLLAGAALLTAFGAAAVVPEWNLHRTASRANAVAPRDYVVAGTLQAFACVYAVALVWIWTRRNGRRQGGFWAAVLLSATVAAAAKYAADVIDGVLHAGEDVVTDGLYCLAAAGVVLIWVASARIHGWGEPPRLKAGGAVDVRCPSCGYCMVGLRESRCPECGTGYTLDELLGRQDFTTRASRRDGRPVADVPVSPGNGSEPGAH